MAGKNRAKNSIFIDKTGGTLTANPIQSAIDDLVPADETAFAAADIDDIGKTVNLILAALREALIIAPSSSEE